MRFPSHAVSAAHIWVGARKGGRKAAVGGSHSQRVARIGGRSGAAGRQLLKGAMRFTPRTY
jgi:hypothetical protein